MKMRTLTVLTLVAAIANVASAAITMEVVEVDNTAQLTGYVTQDIVVTTDTDWLDAALIVQPDENGLIYQDDLGNTNPQSPNAAFFDAFPSLEFDTYLSNGVLEEYVSVAGAPLLTGLLRSSTLTRPTSVG